MASRVYAGYPRVSRQGTREDERFRSPQFQAEMIERYAAAEGLTVRMFEAEVDVSGSKPKRAILETIVQAIERGELAGIVVAKLDRLSRLAPRDRLELFERIEGAGGVVLSASEQLDASTPEGRFARDVFLGIARMQWEKYRDGFATAKANAIANGIAVMTRAPFGYRFNAEHGLELVHQEADVVRGMFELRAAGGSLGDVLAYFEDATGRSSSRQTMREMLANRVYLGELRYGRGEDALVNAGAHEPAIAVELFEAVRALSAARGRKHGHYAGGKPKSLLAGVARCEGCGRGLIQSRGGTGGREAVYKCPSDARHCERRATIYMRELDRYVIAEVLAWAEPVADVEVAVSIASEPTRPVSREVIEERIAEAERFRDEWASSTVLQASLGIEAYADGLRIRQEMVDGRVRELERLGERTTFEHARATVRELLEDEAAELEERRRLLGVVLDGVAVRRTPRRGAPAAERAVLRFAAEAVAEDALELGEEAAA